MRTRFALKPSVSGLETRDVPSAVAIHHGLAHPAAPHHRPPAHHHTAPVATPPVAAPAIAAPTTPAPSPAIVQPSAYAWSYVGTATLYTPAVAYAGYNTQQVAMVLANSGLSASQINGLLDGQTVTILDTTDNQVAEKFMSGYIIPSVLQVHYYIQTGPLSS